jgi:hypothetical protein
MDNKKIGFFSLISVLILIGVYFVIAGTITVTSPAIEYQTQGNFTITCTATPGTGENITNMSLWISTVNSPGVWALNLSNKSALTANAYTFTINGTNPSVFAEGNYTYGCAYVNQTSALSGGAMNYTWSANQTFIVDWTPATIKLTSPNNSNFSYGYQFNTTIPFEFNTTDNWGHYLDCSLYVDGVAKNSTIRISSNATTVMRTNITAFTSGIDAGNHFWNVSCLDTTGNVRATSFINGVSNEYGRFTIYDASLPTSTVSVNDETITKGTSFTLTCASTDPVTPTGSLTYMFGIKDPGNSDYSEFSSSTTTYEYTSTDTAGEYVAKCKAKDTAGNWGTYSTTVTITASVSSSESGGSSGGSSSGSTTVSDPTILGGQTEALGDLSADSSAFYAYTDAELTFTLNEEAHTMVIDEIDNYAKTATITFSSEPVTVTVELNETQNVDLNGDGANDIQVKLDSVNTYGKAHLTITDISTEQQPEVTPPTTPTTPTPTTPTTPTDVTGSEKPKTSIGIWIVLAIVIIGLVLFFVFKKKKK